MLYDNFSSDTRIFRDRPVYVHIRTCVYLVLQTIRSHRDRISFDITADERNAEWKHQMLLCNLCNFMAEDRVKFLSMLLCHGA